MMKKINTKILYILQLPPPYHGAAYINQVIYESPIINQNIEKKIIPINFVQDLSDIGKLSLKKCYAFFILMLKLFYNTLTFKQNYIYFTCNCTGIAFFRDSIIIIFCKLLTKKLILHFHGKGIAENSKKRFYKHIYQFLFSNTSLIFVSPYLKKSECVRLTLKNANLYAVENGIKPIKEQLIHKKKQNNITRLLFLSTLMPSKGIYILLNSIAFLTQKNQNFHLTMVGDPLQTDELEKIKCTLQELEINEFVTLYPAVYTEKKYDFFNKSDIFIHPTLNDSFGLVILEAMQFARPVISTYEGGIPDIVINEKTGILVKKDNMQSLANAILDLINNPDKAQAMGDAGQKRFFEKYTINHFEENMRNTIQQIINS